jgi:hypothetical protein
MDEVKRLVEEYKQNKEVHIVPEGEAKKWWNIGRKDYSKPIPRAKGHYKGGRK